MFGQTETGLVYRDEERAAQIVDDLRVINADVVGLTEIWDDDLRRGIQTTLTDRYPYAHASPSGAGIADIAEALREQWPRLAPPLLARIEGMVDFFGQSHYRVRDDGLWERALGVFSEDLRFRALKSLFRLPNAWGAGLLLLSKYPIVRGRFHPHPITSGLECFTRKGVLETNIELPTGTQVTTLLTHLQQGRTAKDIQARRLQVNQIAALQEASDNPTIVMGDFNITAERAETGEMTPEFVWMRRRLRMGDAYRTVHPDARTKHGFTYEPNNPLAVRFGVVGSPDEIAERIDLLLLGGLEARRAQVLRDGFRIRDGDPTSDHLPLWARVGAAALAA